MTLVNEHFIVHLKPGGVPVTVDQQAPQQMPQQSHQQG